MKKLSKNLGDWENKNSKFLSIYVILISHKNWKGRLNNN